MRLLVQMESEGACFETAEHARVEVAHILAQILADVRDNYAGNRIRDINGNTIGSWALEAHPEDRPEPTNRLAGYDGARWNLDTAARWTVDLRTRAEKRWLRARDDREQAHRAGILETDPGHRPQPGFCVHCGMLGGAIGDVDPETGEDLAPGAQCPDLHRHPRPCQVAPEEN